MARQRYLSARTQQRDPAAGLAAHVDAQRAGAAHAAQGPRADAQADAAGAREGRGGEALAVAQEHDAAAAAGAAPALDDEPPGPRQPDAAADEGDARLRCGRRDGFADGRTGARLPV